MKLIPEQPRYLLFMIGLILLLVSHALFDTGTIGAHMADITFLIVLITTIFAASHRIWFAIAIAVLGLPMFASQILSQFLDYNTLILSNYGFGALFFSCLFIAILAHTLQTDKVTMNTIYGAVSVYLLIGLAWAFLFGLIEYFHPGTFYIPDELDAHTTSPQQQFNALSYYSFTTLTTLGFGDINAVLPIARTLSYLEAVLGQLYLTILMARLVGLYVTTAKNKR